MRANASSSPSSALPSLIFSDEFLYLFILLSSLFLGFFIRRLEEPRLRRRFSSSVGILFLFSFCRYDAGYALFAAGINAAIVHFAGSKLRNILSFGFSFAFLAFFRCATSFGLPQPRPLANAVQLILSLKSIALAFEATDAEVAASEISKVDDSDEKETIESTDRLRLQRSAEAFPSPMDCFAYSFCYVGLFTGPFFKYRTWLDWTVNGQLTSHLSTRPFLAQKLIWIPALAAIHWAIKGLFPLEFVDSPEFEELCFWRRCFYMVPTFTVFRTRMYLAWLLAECVAVAAAFGAYPSSCRSRPGDGPQNLLALRQPKEAGSSSLDFDFETIRNIDIIGVELKPTARTAMRCWNMSVQYWLANYVYKRFSPRRYGTLVTMLVSAYWHGFHAGYYLSFLTVPLVVAVDDLWAGLVRKKLEKQQQQRSSSSPTTITRPLLIYDWVNWFLRCRAYDYMCMGFLMLSFERTIKYWRSIYFLPHIAYALLLLLGLLLKKTSLFHSIVDKDGRTKRD